METDRAKIGSAFRAHSRITEPPPVHFPIDSEMVALQKELIVKVQEVFSRRLVSYSRILSISYEEITNNCQVRVTYVVGTYAARSFQNSAHKPL
jgi:hypothetical protein